MSRIENALRQHSGVDDFKINTTRTESCQLFFVKGTLETVRSTDNTDIKVTLYVRHDGKMGDADFPVFPSTTDEQLQSLIDEAVEKARLIDNEAYELPEAVTADYSQLYGGSTSDDLAASTANAIFSANRLPGGSQNSVEVFIDTKTISVINSRGLDLKQNCCSGMAEVIPTYNGEKQSVELYEQYHFASLDTEDLTKEITEMMQSARNRYYAAVPAAIGDCPVVFNRKELAEFFRDICSNLNYSTVYAHASVFRKGEPVQVDPTGDRLTVTMTGMLENDPKSSHFDTDGVLLGSQTIIENGIAVNYYGSSRFGQYLGENPTGQLPCMCIAAGTAEKALFSKGRFLEVLSMSGLQVDFFTDYIGGEVRLAMLHDGESVTPVTGISVSGSLKSALACIRLSDTIVSGNGYCGPEKALITGMNIF